MNQLYKELLETVKENFIFLILIDDTLDVSQTLQGKQVLCAAAALAGIVSNSARAVVTILRLL